MEIKCKKCGNKWNYTSKSFHWATCPKCHRKNNVTIWENLKYATYINCPQCGQSFPKKRNESMYCNAWCMSRANTSKGGKAVHAKYDLSGENNPNWKGGISKDNYHYRKLQLERYPGRDKCRRALNRAKQSGKITPPSTCQHCNIKSKVHAHHEDYSKPLEVTWLCRTCHRKLHGGKRVIIPAKPCLFPLYRNKTGLVERAFPQREL